MICNYVRVIRSLKLLFLDDAVLVADSKGKLIWGLIFNEFAVELRVNPAKRKNYEN